CVESFSVIGGDEEPISADRREIEIVVNSQPRQHFGKHVDHLCPLFRRRICRGAVPLETSIAAGLASRNGGKGRAQPFSYDSPNRRPNRGNSRNTGARAVKSQQDGQEGDATPPFPAAPRSPRRLLRYPPPSRTA